MPTEDDLRLQQVTAEYEALVHAMQSGVMAEMELGLNKAHTPKQLRTGINSAMVETSVLVQLLIDRGLLTSVEWAERLRDGMRAEVDRYEARLAEHYGRKITLA